MRFITNEVKIGQFLQVGYVVLQCTTSDAARCAGCYMAGCNNCDEIVGICSREVRADGRNVVFIPATITGYMDKNGKHIEEGSILKIWLEDDIEEEGGIWTYLFVACVALKGFVLWGPLMTLEDAEPLEDWEDLQNYEVVGNVNNIDDYNKYFVDDPNS